VSELGWDNSPFSDDNLSSKKVYPGFVFRCPGNKAWNDRGRVTTKSAVLMFENVTRVAKATPLAQRQTWLKVKIEQKAELAAMVINLSEELASTLALPEGVIEKDFIDVFRINAVSVLLF
jgi:hypothetical protein